MRELEKSASVVSLVKKNLGLMRERAINQMFQGEYRRGRGAYNQDKNPNHDLSLRTFRNSFPHLLPHDEQFRSSPLR